MLFKIFIYSSVLFIINQSTNSFSQRFRRLAPNYEPKCRDQTTAVDQVYQYNKSASARRKRFVLFPEFINYLNDSRYIHRPTQFSYWISNFYPNRINTDYIHYCIEHIIQQINTVLDNDITVHRALEPDEANFHFQFFDYTKCPMDDVPEATVDGVKIFDTLYIYPVDLTRESRYRAHGGISLIDGDKPISTIKFNMQQTFLQGEDLVYDPVIYTCDDDTNKCDIDVYYILLHETLHGFGIEHTTNPQEPIPPNPRMQSVMHFSPIRLLCHDDIRAIRMVYKLPVVRKNVEYDDTCRRDFPMNPLQKLMYRLGRFLILSLIMFLLISTIIFILTLIYILIRYFLYLSKSNEIRKQTSTISTGSWFIKDKKPTIRKTRKDRYHGYLWHDELL